MAKNNAWYEENKSNILDMYYANKPILDICSELQLIYKKLKEWNVTKRKRLASPERCNALHKINAHYFDVIDSEHKAYWLGFMVSDGFVNEKEISFCLKKTDRKIIEEFKKDLDSDHPIGTNANGNPVLVIVCKQLCRALIDKGLHNRKSWSIDIHRIRSYVPSEYEHHFIRGLFDGDGSIRYYHYSYLKKPQYHLGFTGCENVCLYVREKFKLQRRLVREGNKTYTMISRNPIDICRIFEYLYRDATIYMSRKYNTFKEIQMMTFNDYNKAISSEMKV